MSLGGSRRRLKCEAQIGLAMRKAPSLNRRPLVYQRNTKLSKSRPGSSGQRSESGGLHDDDGCGDGGNDSFACLGGDRFGTQRPQPAGGKPCVGNQELGPAAVETHADVRRRRHRRMAQCARAVAKQTNFRRDNGDGGRLALRADHATPQGSGPWEPQKEIEGGIQCSRISTEFSTVTLF